MKIDQSSKSQLFAHISRDTMNRVFKMLRQERVLHHQYRDDELLLYILCARLEGFPEYTDL
jgi:hypothetical protein